MSKTHHLKTWPEYLSLIRDGRKTFEIRDNDRGFQEGDLVVLQGWEPSNGEYTGEHVQADVGYVLPDGAWGLPSNKVAFSLLNVRFQP